MSKQNNNIDIGDFCRNKLDGYTKSPPEHIYQNISSTIIAEAGAKSGLSTIIKQKSFLYSFFTGLGIIIGVAITFVYVNDSALQSEQTAINMHTPQVEQVEKIEIITEPTQTTLSEEPVAVQKEAAPTKPAVIKEQISDQGPSNSKEEEFSNTESTESTESTQNTTDEVATETNKSIKKVNNKRKKYYINANKFDNVIAIHFINELDESVLVKTKPETNSFGFIPVDINSLSRGIYQIIIETNSEKIKDKKITIKE